MNDEKLLTEFPQLETVRLKLRKLSAADANDIFEYACIQEAAHFLIWEPHTSINDSSEFISFADQQFNDSNSIIWGIELKEEKKLIGTIDLRGYSSLHRCGDVGYVISQKYWRRGIVSEAFRALIDFGFGVLNLNRIESHCEHENTGSWKVMEKAGLVYEGTLREKILIKGKFRTMKMYSILKSDWLNNDKN
ncbi:MAG: ribosomal-protein-alanine N-acetyltransferase [Ignavibacteria bacterium]|nr:MAG: ribosomal-protein-alanine N-acetyltransferase [Ignavibacteria bacterium]KAF0161549.1 MAG: ribosomal-protein-alanine N-acetyltransferase [Ignavibacteria bacterium]